MWPLVRIICPISKQLMIFKDFNLNTADGLIQYPTGYKGKVPIMMGPEAITTQRDWPRDKTAPQYKEAYQELTFYNDEGYRQARYIQERGSLAESCSEGLRHVHKIASLSPCERGQFPNPSKVWLSNPIDVASERDCYRHIGQLRGKVALQIGGKGTFAITALLAGASRAVLVTPMLGEAAVAIEIANIYGLADNLQCIVGIAEELPIANEELDVCFVGGCVHHFRTELAFPEISRVLRPGGKFAAIEPWRALGYGIGTKIFGKREANAFCSPMTPERMAPLDKSFRDAAYVQHGSLTRYPSIVAQKAGISFRVPTAEWVADVDDKICNCIPFARRAGSGVAILATK